jgi:hypothetical protein
MLLLQWAELMQHLYSVSPRKCLSQGGQGAAAGGGRLHFNSIQKALWHDHFYNSITDASLFFTPDGSMFSFPRRVFYFVNA